MLLYLQVFSDFQIEVLEHTHTHKHTRSTLHLYSRGQSHYIYSGENAW